MKTTVLILAVAASFITSALYAASKPDRAAIARGSYLVNKASMCVDCHTPMNSNGTPDTKRQLAGAKLLFKPTVKLPEWETHAPNLTPAGFLKRWNDQQVVRFLMTGRTPKGDHAEPPMPQYRFSRSDATAIAAYLRSLPPVKQTAVR